jgi:hypothetical protein
MFSSGSEKDESEENEFKDEDPEKEYSCIGCERTSKRSIFRGLFL